MKGGTDGEEKKWRESEGKRAIKKKGAERESRYLKGKEMGGRVP